MNLNKSVFACALACAGVSGQVLAHAPSLVPQVAVFMAGTSMVQKWLGHYAATHCKPGTLDVYYDTATNGVSHRAYFCTATATDPAVDGQKVLINDNSQFESYGVLPVARGLAIPRMTVSSASCGTASVGVDAETGAPLWKCASLVSAVPNAGVTDVEPSMFLSLANADQVHFPNMLFNDATDAPNLSVGGPVLAWVLGIPVTNDLGIANLSREQILSIFSWTYTDWSQVSPSLPSGPITICRGVPGSGAQAGINAIFMNDPCGGPFGANLMSRTSQNGADPYVINNATAADMTSCLNTHSKAIGLLGTDTQPVFGTDKWSFVSINHEAPTVENAAIGNYDYAIEQSMQWRIRTVNGAPAATAPQIALLSAMAYSGGDPAYLQTRAGVAAVPTNSFAPSIPYSATNPVMWGTRSGHTCEPTQLLFP